MTEQNEQTDFDIKRTPNGFAWGPLEVICEASHASTGVYRALDTLRERLDIRVTPRGFIRLGIVSTKGKPGPLPSANLDPLAISARELAAVLRGSNNTYERIAALEKLEAIL